MSYNADNPLIVQSDRTLLMEVASPQYEECREAVAQFAELEKSPEHIHTYRVSNLSLWNAAAAGFTAEQMLGVLQKYTKFPIPQNIPADIAETVSRYGRVRLERAGDTEGESRVDNRRIMFEPPLGVTFTVDQAARRITVTHVWAFET